MSIVFNDPNGTPLRCTGCATPIPHAAAPCPCIDPLRAAPATDQTTTLFWKLPTTRKARLWTVTRLAGDGHAYLKSEDAEAVVRLPEGSGSVVLYRRGKSISSVFDNTPSTARVILAALNPSKE